MAIHIIRGRTGEHLAVEYLQGLGYKILYCNWRYRQFEIDVIATHQNVLHIIEVKTRYSLDFGFPEEAVSRRKFRNLQHAADHFMTLYPHWKRMQFDILSIMRSLVNDQYLLIEDVYF